MSLIQIHTTHKCNKCNETYTEVVNKKYSRLYCDSCLLDEIISIYTPNIQEYYSSSTLDEYSNVVDKEYKGT